MKTWYFVAASAVCFGIAAIIALPLHHAGLINGLFAATGELLAIVWSVQVIRGKSHIALKIGAGLILVIGAALLMATVGTLIKDRLA